MGGKRWDGRGQEKRSGERGCRDVAPPGRGEHIPKAGSPKQTPPQGIPTFEDKILQRAVLMVLEPVYETDCLDVSDGFRPGRGAHGALDSLWRQAMKLGGDWIV